MAEDLPHEPYDASDSAAEGNARRDAARFAREDADVWRTVMHTKTGRACLLRLLDRCHINNSPDFGEETHRQARALGREDVGKEILVTVMAASVDLYMKAIKEQQEEVDRVAEVRRKEQRARDEVEAPPRAEDMVSVNLPPPAGFPGGPPLPPKPKKGG